MFKKLSILIAAYNEEATLHRCLTRVLAAPLPEGLQSEVVLVDDGSSDRTWTIASELAAMNSRVRVFRLSKNSGKGAALRRAVAEMSGDITLFQDADLEYDPNDYPRLLKPILEGRADVVFGSRFTGEERKVLYFWHMAGNRLLTLLSNMLNNINLTDMETGYKAFVAARLRSIPLQSNRFGIEPEITAKAALNRLRIYEVPIRYNGRTYEEGKKISWKDGMAALWFIFKYRFSSNYADAGTVALDALEQAPAFNRWMFEAIRPYLGNRVVELGAGRGNLSKHLKTGRDLLLVDYRPDYLEELQSRWSHLDNIRFALVDLTVERSYEVIREFRPDTVVCLNVLEHIEDDAQVLRLLYGAVPSEAKMVFLVPFNSKLMSQFDREIGHFRRYDSGELERKMEAAGFSMVVQFYFNKAGVLAWWVGNQLSGQKRITPWQLRFYNWMTPLFRILDRVLPGAGLSTVVVASKR